MKLSNKKIIVSVLALAMGAALAGSISGSVAWYQYSTRASAVVNGVSAGVTGDLAVSIDGGAYAHKATGTSYDYLPISADSGTAGSLTYRNHPVYQTAALPQITAAQLTAQNAASPVYYHDFVFSFEFLESDTTTAADATNNKGVEVVKEVYITYFDIEGTFAPAVRAEIIPYTGTPYLVSDSTTAETVTTKAAAGLDLNNNTKVDTNLWDCTDASGDTIVYTNGTESYTTAAHSSILTTVSDPYDISGYKVAQTDKGTSNLTIRVWIEGWAEIGSKVVWDTANIGQEFNINIQFACEANQ